MSIKALQEAIRVKKTPIALGLRPEPDKIATQILKQFTEMYGPGAMAEAETLRYHGTQAIAAAAEKLAAVMVCADSYLRLGPMGMDVLYNLISAAKGQGLYVILDVAARCPDTWWPTGCDAVTVNPYVGAEVCAVPADKAAFALCRTGAAGSHDVQKLIAGDRHLYLALAQQMARRGAGIALESGYALDIRDLRRKLDKTFLLLTHCTPQAASVAFDDYGHGALAADGDIQYAEDPAAAVEQAIAAMKEWVSVV